MSRIQFLTGNGGLPKLVLHTAASTAEVYLHGASVTHFQKHGEPPLLFLSAQSRFQADAPIRGGIPVIFPWFGKPADKPLQHGSVRARPWELGEIQTHADGSLTVKLALPPSPDLDGAIRVEYLVAASDALTVELSVTNGSPQPLQFEDCLHTYFNVGDIAATRVVGLRGVEYLDALDSRKRKTEAHDAIGFTGEVDRIYVNVPPVTEIHDAALRRVIRVATENARATVVWNPWIAKAKAMPDFGDAEYLRMVCVESGNVAEHRRTLAPGATSRLKVKLSSAPLG
jgi:D-hexose-6-phosphate mutarotase